MLTGDLVRVRDKDGEIRPTFVGAGNAPVQERAANLVDCFQQAIEQGWTRGQLDEEIEAIVGDGRDHKLVRGLAKILADKSEFEVTSPVDPGELRDRVFKRSQQLGPLALERGPLERPIADDVLAAVGAELGLEPAAVAAALYADLRDEQRVVSCDIGDGDALLRRYDVALVQAVLLHASQVKIFLEEPTVPRMRQLFRWIKFHQLVHEAVRVGNELHVTLDGPLSLFKQSTRYGMQLAQFFPALLLQDGRWSMSATVLWTKRQWERTLRVTSADGLVSHLADTGSWESREQQWFAERFRATPSRWTMRSSEEPIDLGGRAILIPDFTFTDGTRTAHLEIVGFWRKDWLMRRVEWLERYGPGNLVLAVSRKLGAGKEALSEFPGAIVDFAEIVPPKAVIEALERVAR